MVIEAKDMRLLENCKSFLLQWMKFLTVPGGKGIFYFFIGSVATSIWDANLLLFVAGAYMSSLGVICVLVHLGLRRQLQRSGIDVGNDSETHSGDSMTVSPNYPDNNASDYYGPPRRPVY